MDLLLSIVYEESLVSDIGRTCLIEVVYKSMVGKMQLCV